MSEYQRPISTSEIASGETGMQSRETEDRDQAANRQQMTDGREMGQARDGGSERSLLVSDTDASSYRQRWTAIQSEFVDEPRSSVEQADGLVAEVMQRVAQGFSQERSKLESQWERGDDISTEDLRQALQHYKSFFQRLLAA